jgi:hypothetical protein
MEMEGKANPGLLPDVAGKERVKVGCCAFVVVQKKYFALGREYGQHEKFFQRDWRDQVHLGLGGAGQMV